ncbi:MAG: hypothetical protein AVDCRST_MAG03-1359, partial [uncultured Rubrobacteraceae bacterium]
ARNSEVLLRDVRDGLGHQVQHARRQQPRSSIPPIIQRTHHPDAPESL